MFHPDLLRGTSLGRAMREYSFFSYEVFEALHLSEEERKTVLECLGNIESELNHSIDNHSQRLIVSNIELFLNYCTRFYERQFITRKHVNSDALSRFESLLNDNFKSGLPDVGQFEKMMLDMLFEKDKRCYIEGVTQDQLSDWMADLNLYPSLFLAILLARFSLFP